MRKVCYIFPNFFFIGAQRAAAATIRSLCQRGWDVSVVVVDSRGDMRHELPAGVAVVELPLVPVLSSIPLMRIFAWPLALRKILKVMAPSYCVSICPQTNFTLILYRLLFKRHSIFIGEEHQHLTNAMENDPDDFPRPWRYFYLFALKNYHRLDFVRCVSNAAAMDFISQWGIPSKAVRTIYPAFDLARIKARGEKATRSNSVPVVCSVGRLTTQKDFALLIRAFSYVRAQTKAILKIVGVGPEEAALRSLIVELGLQKDVQLLGFVEYAEEVIASSDLFVMTSIWEGFPATLVEAMVLGTAVVSVNCESGPSELIEDGVTGTLVNSRHPPEIGRAVLWSINNPDLRCSMACKAREAVERFSLDATVTDLENLLLSGS